MPRCNAPCQSSQLPLIALAVAGLFYTASSPAIFAQHVDAQNDVTSPTPKATVVLRLTFDNAKPSEKPAGLSTEKTAEKPADKPAEKPAEKPVDKLAEKPSEKPDERSADKPAENSNEGLTDAKFALLSLTGDALGAGPRPPTYPGFSPGNMAAQFTSSTSPQIIRDGGKHPELRFNQGDTIVIEAWVRPSSLADGAFAYIVGKGRNGRAEFDEKNQNFALRLRGDKDGPKLSFLFGSTPAKPVESTTDESKPEEQKPEGKSTGKSAGKSEWHRWTSKEVLGADVPWHHVAIRYTFGKPDSIRGYIDGRETTGDWDMGGKTTRPPIVDVDDLSVGSGNGGGAGNRFDGAIDELTVYRGDVPAEELLRRFQFVPPPPALALEQVPADRVLVQICEEGLPPRYGWPAIAPPATETFDEELMAVVGLPQKYVDTGVRGDRANPLLLRYAARVTLPEGRHRLLLRARGLTRLIVDGKSILTLAAPKGDEGGHSKVPSEEEYLNLGPDFRFAPPGTQEAWAEFEAPGREQLFVCETLVGGAARSSKVRPELGETVVAVSLAGSQSWELLGPGDRRMAYNDATWPEFAANRAKRIEQMDAAARAARRAEHSAYWNRRRDAAQKWLAATPETAVPELPAGYPAQSPIDHFIAARLVAAQQVQRTAAAGEVDFYRDIQPILEAKCWDCHRGGKSKGGLRLDSLASARKGGESGLAAVEPGRIAASELLIRVRSTDPDTVMPPRGVRLTPQEIQLIERWIAGGATWPDYRVEKFELTPLCDDHTFVRRVALDTVGVPPSLDELRELFAKPSDQWRKQVIDRYLADPRTADHAMGYWQDLLAENPNILNPTLNNTGPFRWWLYESLVDDKPLDLMVTELLRMRGSERFGGPAGFATASQNDAPMAAKGTIVSSAFLGIEMKCARCHDAPAHLSRQEELFQLAALLSTQPVEVPKSSSVALDKLLEGGRKPLIEVTLKPGQKVEPKWPFAGLSDEAAATSLAESADDSRDRLAALVTAPQNERFAQVMANRIWARLMGRGIVEPVDDWEKNAPSHPELLRWLGRELVRSGYQTKHVMRLVMNSHAYQRATDRDLKEPSPLFVAPAVRRLGAEQIVDSMFHATGKPFRLEEVSLDVDGRRDLKNSITLGVPRRAWMLTSTSNERDRPSLALPRVQAVCDVLQAFGWRGARQDPSSHRETAPNALQPAILAHGIVATWLTRLSDDHGVTRLALVDQPLNQFIDQLFLQLATRLPTDDERARYTEYLRPGYDTRVTPDSAKSGATAGANGPDTNKPDTKVERRPRRYVSWSNHLDPEATVLRQQEEQAARAGDPPTRRLSSDWRERLEDVVWTLVNSPEMVFTR